MKILLYSKWKLKLKEVSLLREEYCYQNLLTFTVSHIHLLKTNKILSRSARQSNRIKMVSRSRGKSKNIQRVALEYEI